MTAEPDDAHAQRLRNRAHGRLIDWGQHRADLGNLGFNSSSATERMRQRAHGGDRSTRPSQLNSVERSVVRLERTLQTDMAVRALRPKIREAIHARYAHDRTVAVWAREIGITPAAANKRMSRGLLEVGYLLERWRTPDPVEDA